MQEFNKKNKNRVFNAVNGEMSYKKLTAPELHQFVLHWNYDDGIDPFKWIIKQKYLDKGTALCLYWMLQPDYFCRFKNESEIKNQLNYENYKLIKEIEEKYVSGFYTDENFSFDPKKEFLDQNINVSCIPSLMTVKSAGTVFERQDIEFAFLRKPTEKELKSVISKIGDAVKIIQISNPNFKYDQTDEAIKAIIESVEYWKEKDSGIIKIKNLSYLWLDCVCKSHNWEWIVWDWETGNNIGITNPSKELTCLAGTIIKHTIDGFQKSSIISDLYEDLKGVTNFFDLKKDPYSGIGLLFSTNHLKFRE